MNTEKIAALTEILRRGRKIVFFGGAGVSTESGIPDFRSARGLYSRDLGTTVSPEEMISHSFFLAHTAQFYDFYREHLIFPDARPNRAHQALARLEADGRLSAVVTQNIDGLHQAAGSRNVYELHGSVHRNTCLRCGKRFPLDFITGTTGVPRCPVCGGLVKPDVVLYEEPLDDDTVDGAIRAIREADTLLIGGTSLAVYPAAGMIRYFRGHTLVILNLSPTPHDRDADLLITDPIGEALGAAVDLLLH